MLSEKEKENTHKCFDQQKEYGGSIWKWWMFKELQKSSWATKLLGKDSIGFLFTVAKNNAKEIYIHCS